MRLSRRLGEWVKRLTTAGLKRGIDFALTIHDLNVIVSSTVDSIAHKLTRVGESEARLREWE